MPVSAQDEYLFVYGTLLRSAGHPEHRILEKGAVLQGAATFRGKLFLIESYPALIPSSSQGDAFGGTVDSVRGELYRLNEPPLVFGRLDRYEGFDPANPRQSLYIREKREVNLTERGTPVNSWIYLYNRPTRHLTPIPSGDYLSFMENA